MALRLKFARLNLLQSVARSSPRKRCCGSGCQKEKRAAAGQENHSPETWSPALGVVAFRQRVVGSPLLYIECVASM